MLTDNNIDLYVTYTAVHYKSFFEDCWHILKMYSWPNKISHQHHVPLKSFSKYTYQKFIRNDLKVAIQSNEAESESNSL